MLAAVVYGYCRRPSGAPRNGRADGTPPPPDQLHDAREGPVRHGDVEVRVASASVGRVEVRNAVGQVGPSENEYLRVKLRITNLSADRKLTYKGWAGASLRATGYAKLSDESGRAYKRVTSGPWVNAVGQVAGTVKLPPGGSVSDQLLFEKSAADAKKLHLELPMSAVGATGRLRFAVRGEDIGRASGPDGPGVTSLPRRKGK